MGLPDGWNKYNRVGKQVHNTRFIAFKVPLREATNKVYHVAEENQLHPKLLVQLIPKLGLIIDLTNTVKYYNPDEFLKLGVQYKKIKVEGQRIPNKDCSIQFRDVVNEFLNENENNDKLIGVHCTHGLNRSGFLICRYMIEEMQIPPLEAIAAFEVGRGHKMERENYIARLKSLTLNDEFSIPQLKSLAINTETEKATQTSRGYWISESSIPTHHRSSGYAQSDSSTDQRQQVQLIGHGVHRSDLIPDGHGGYFVHLTKKDIQCHESRYDKKTHFRGKSDRSKKRSHQSIPYQQRHPNEPNMTRPPPRGRHGENSMYMGNSLPFSGNNMTEGLLLMQNMGMIVPRSNQY